MSTAYGTNPMNTTHNAETKRLIATLGVAAAYAVAPIPAGLTVDLTADVVPVPASGRAQQKRRFGGTGGNAVVVGNGGNGGNGGLGPFAFANGSAGTGGTGGLLFGLNGMNGLP